MICPVVDAGMSRMYENRGKSAGQEALERKRSTSPNPRSLPHTFDYDAERAWIRERQEPFALSTLFCVPGGGSGSAGLPDPLLVVFKANPSGTWLIPAKVEAQEVKNRLWTGGGVEDRRVRDGDWLSVARTCKMKGTATAC